MDILIERAKLSQEQKEKSLNFMDKLEALVHDTFGENVLVLAFTCEHVFHENDNSDLKITAFSKMNPADVDSLVLHVAKATAMKQREDKLRGHINKILEG